MSVDIDKLFTDLFLKDEVEVKLGKTAMIRARLMHNPKGIGIGISKLGGNCHGIHCPVDSMAEALAFLRDAWYDIFKTTLPEKVPAPKRTWYVTLVRGHKPYPFIESATYPNLKDFECFNSEDKKGHMLAIDVRKYPELNEYESDGQGNIFIPEYEINRIKEYSDIEYKSR